MRRPGWGVLDGASSRPKVVLFWVNKASDETFFSDMGFSSGYRDLVVWQEAMNLAVLVYQFSSEFPKQETYGLTAQVRKAAVSVPSNIAEGAGRNSSGELHHFLGIASGSLAELTTQLELAERLKYVRVDSNAAAQIQRVGLLLQALRRSCNSN